MSDLNQHKTIRLADYRAPDFRIPRTRLEFDLQPTNTRVTSHLDVERQDGSANLMLNGDALKLLEVYIGDRKLTDKEWENLTPVGTLKVPRLVFARNSSKLLASSRVILDDLANTLSTSQYYVKIRGNATRAGDQELNKQLACLSGPRETGASLGLVRQPPKKVEQPSTSEFPV